VVIGHLPLEKWGNPLEEEQEAGSKHKNGAVIYRFFLIKGNLKTEFYTLVIFTKT